MPNVVKTFIASASELQTSDLYMTVKATLFTVPEANLNGVRCTHDFLHEIVENQGKYIGLPLCADVKNLANGQYEKLGHCYNALTGTFATSMIGSFYEFEAVANDDGSEALIGYARILKRNKTVCKAIGELFAEGALKFSFEINCGSYEELQDGTILIDKADENYLEGMCVVSFPACPDAVALQLVAEIEACNKDLNKEAEHMPNEETVVAEAEVETAAEEKVQQETAEVKSEPEVEVAAAQEEEKPEDEESKEEAPEENKETAEIVVNKEHTEIDNVSAYDTDTCEEVRETVVHTVETRTYAENAEANVVAEESAEAEKKEEAECKGDEKKEAAELQEAIAELRKELAEMRTGIEDFRKLFAEQEKQRFESVNPFMAELNQPKKYSLLDEEEHSSQQHYSLLDPM